MGQAVVDLPDPLEAPPPTTLSGTDDLLAQLAGDEIDRLLAEADEPRPAPAVAEPAPDAVAAPLAAAVAPVATASNEPAPTATTVAAAPAPSTPVTSSAIAEDDLDSLLNELNNAAMPVTPAAPAAAEPAQPKSLTDQVPDVLAQFGEPVAPAPAAAAPAAASPALASKPASAIAPVVATPSAPGEAVEAVMSPAEREALNLSNLSDETAAAEEHDAVEAAAAAAAAAEKSSLRPAVRVLEWINAPLSFVPDAVRDTIGKVAILTFVNSIAVLIYVLFFRH